MAHGRCWAAIAALVASTSVRAEECIRYIHFSAHWNAVKNWNTSDLEVLFINRPAERNQRAKHANE